MVRSTIEYGAIIWQGAKDKTSLEAVQRKGLALCLNLSQTSGREALEVATGMLPLDLRLQEIAVREIAKIQAKQITHPMKQALVQLQEDPSTPRYVSPLALAQAQATEMEKTTGISTRLIEPEMDYEDDKSLYRSRTRPEYWNRLGSSKDRTKDQEALGRETIMDLMMEAPEHATFAFTDGSCISNPGPCGAGAVIYPPDGEETRLTRPVSNHGSILLAELVAVMMVLEQVIQFPVLVSGKCLKIFSDSQSTVGILTMGWKFNSHRGIVMEIKKLLKALADITIEILWTPGHAGLQGNDIADELAKGGAKEAQAMPKDSKTVTLQEVKDASHKTSMIIWQTRWDNSTTGRRFFEFTPSVDFKRQLDRPSKTAYQSILQLQTGYSILNAHRHKIGQIFVSPACTCGAPETTEHFLLECNQYNLQRENLARSLQTHLGILALDTHTLLGTDDHPEIPS